MDHTIVLAIEQFAQRSKLAKGEYRETFPINGNGFDDSKCKAALAENVATATFSRSGNYLTIVKA